MSAWKTFQVSEKDGSREVWAFHRVRAWNVTLKRYVTGWELRTADGCVRFSEGTWMDFVPFVRLVAGNYGVEVSL